MQYVAFALVIIGAFMAYGAKKLLGPDAAEGKIAGLKLIGFALCLAGAILIFTL